MAVIPGDIEGVAAYGLYFLRARRLLVHRQKSVGGFGRLAGTAIVIVALFGAGGAGTGVAQPLKAVMRVVAVVPVDVHAGSGGDVDFDGFGVDGH